MTAEELWKEYSEKYNVPQDTHFEAWAFCGGGEMADVLSKLVLEGKKFGTASIYEDYLAEGDQIPSDRLYNVILNSKGEAVCVARNFEVKVEPFLRVSDYHGYSEGEEERNLTAWRRIHTSYWQPDLENLHLKSVNDCHVVEEKFTLEYVAEEYRGESVDREECFLIEPNMRYAEQIKAYRNSMLEINSDMSGCLSLKRMPDVKEWVDYAYEWGNPMRDLGENGVRGTLLMCIRKSDDKLVGMVQIFSAPKGHKRALVGNIGYSVLPSERRKGYAKFMLKKALDFAKFGLEVAHPIVSVMPENEASRRTILANGGVYLDTVTLEENEILERYVF